MLEHRINSCHFFREQQCPNQLMMERAYLVPHLLDSEQFQECLKLHLSCKCFEMSGKEKDFPVRLRD